MNETFKYTEKSGKSGKKSISSKKISGYTFDQNKSLSFG